MKSRSPKERKRWQPSGNHRPVWAFALIAAALSLLTLMPFWPAVERSEAVLTAGAAAFVLRTAGQDVVAEGPDLGRSHGSTLLRVEERCAISPYAILLVAGIFASSAAAALKAGGIAVALVALGLLNAVRVAGLFLASAYAPGWFPVAHLQLAPTLLLISVVGLAVLLLALLKRGQPS